MLAASSDVSDHIRALASEVGVDLDDKGTRVWDHFSHAVLDGKPDHTAIVASDVVPNPVITGAVKVSFSAIVLYVALDAPA